MKRASPLATVMTECSHRSMSARRLVRDPRPLAKVLLPLGLLLSSGAMLDRWIFVLLSPALELALEPAADEPALAEALSELEAQRDANA